MASDLCDKCKGDFIKACHEAMDRVSFPHINTMMVIVEGEADDQGRKPVMLYTSEPYKPYVLDLLLDMMSDVQQAIIKEAQETRQ